MKVCSYCGKKIRGDAIRYRYIDGNENYYYWLHKRCKKIVKKKAKKENCPMYEILDEA